MYRLTRDHIFVFIRLKFISHVYNHVAGYENEKQRAPRQGALNLSVHTPIKLSKKSDRACERMSINNNYDFQREFSVSIPTRKECRSFYC